MNSLNDLNTYSAQEIEYADSRPTDVIFDPTEPTNQSLVVGEGSTHTVPVPIDIIEVINYNLAAVTYTIDISDFIAGDGSGTTVSWDSLPDGVTLDDSTPGVYTLSGITGARIWNLVKSAEITLPNAYFGDFFYSASIDYTNSSGAASKSWLINVNVFDVNVFSSPSNFVVNLGTSQLITGNPTVIDEGVSTPTYTINITPSIPALITNITAGGSGGTTNFNGTTKVFTITGTKTEVNSRLNALTMTTASAPENDFTLTYVVSNNLNSETDTQIQQMRVSSIQYLSAVTTPAIYYSEDTLTEITGGPQITDIDEDGLGTYTLEVYPGSTANVLTLSATGSGGSTSFNNTTKVLTITGNRTQVNSYIDNISLQPAVDYRFNFTLFYKITTPLSGVATKSQSLVINAIDQNLTNANITRNYTANRGNILFPGLIPQIADNDPTNPTYQLRLSCSSTQGGFTLNSTGNGNTNLFIYTASKETINSIMSGIYYFPPKNFYSTFLMTITLRKNTTANPSVFNDIFTQDFYAVGADAAWANNNQEVLLTSTGQVWTPTFDQYTYGGIVDIYVVGGGGGGGAGGGGGGQVVRDLNITLASQSNTFTLLNLGSGGAAGRVNPNNGTNANNPGGAGGTTRLRNDYNSYVWEAVGGDGGKNQRTYVAGVYTNGGFVMDWDGGRSGGYKSSSVASVTRQNLGGDGDTWAYLYYPYENGGGGGGNGSTGDDWDEGGAGGSSYLGYSAGGQGSRGRTVEAAGTPFTGNGGGAFNVGGSGVVKLVIHS